MQRYLGLVLSRAILRFVRTSGNILDNGSLIIFRHFIYA